MPVSAAAPAMLFSEMEVQKRAHSRMRPPILPPPSWEETGRQTSDLGLRTSATNAGGSAMIRLGYRLWLLIALLLASPGHASGQNSASANDPVLRAMLAELQRSKSQLKLADVQAPYYIDYRLNGCRSVRRRGGVWGGAVLRYERESACCGSWCGWATTSRTVTTAREKASSMLVRSMTTKLDCGTSSGWAPTGRTRRLPRRSPPSRRSLRNTLSTSRWTILRTLLRCNWLRRWPSSIFLPQPWLTHLEEASGLYKSDPQVQSLNASLRFRSPTGIS